LGLNNLVAWLKPMRKVEIKIPASVAGIEYAGVYVVKELKAEERDRIDAETLQVEYDVESGTYKPKVDRSAWRSKLIEAAVEFPSKLTGKYSRKVKIEDLPPRLLDVLFEAAERLNYMRPEEVDFLLKPLFSGSPAGNC